MKTRFLPLFLSAVLTGCGERRVPDDKPRSKLLFETLSPDVRKCMFPMSEIDVATLIGEITTESLIPENLESHVSPGRRLDGWICRVKWVVLRNGGGDPPDKVDVPAFFEVGLMFPELAWNNETWMVATNYDRRSLRLSVPNEALQSVKRGDWVRISGAFDVDSKLRWKYAKSSDLLRPGDSQYLSLGQVTFSSLEKLAN